MIGSRQVQCSSVNIIFILKNYFSSYFNTFEKCSIPCKPIYTNLLEFTCMLCLWSAQGGISHLYIGPVSASYLATKPTKEFKTIKLIELTWMSLYDEMFPQVTFKIFLTTS